MFSRFYMYIFRYYLIFKKYGKCYQNLIIYSNIVISSILKIKPYEEMALIMNDSGHSVFRFYFWGDYVYKYEWIKIFF